MRSSGPVPADLLAAIYEASADASNWPNVVERATIWVGGIAGSFQARKFSPSLEARLISTGVDPSLHQAYLAHYYRNDPHLSHIASLPVGRPLLSLEVLEDRDLVRSEFYSGFCAPQRFHDLQGVVLVRNARWAVSLAMFSHRKRRFDRGTKQRLSALATHVTRALSMGFSFNGLAEAEPGLHAVAQSRAIGLVYVDAQHRIVETHETADAGEWLRGRSHALTIEKQVLRACNVVESSRLASAVKQALAGQPSLHAFGEGASALRVTFALGPRRSPICQERCVSVVVMPAPRELHSSRDLLCELPLSLQAVGRGLLRGLSDKEIAHELDLSIATVRTYVTRLFARVGVHGRRELMLRCPRTQQGR